MNSARQISRGRSIDFLLWHFSRLFLSISGRAQSTSMKRSSSRLTKGEGRSRQWQPEINPSHGHSGLTRESASRQCQSSERKSFENKQTNKRAMPKRGMYPTRDTRGKRLATKGKHQQLICGWNAPHGASSARKVYFFSSPLILTPFSKSRSTESLMRFSLNGEIHHHGGDDGGSGLVSE